MTANVTVVRHNDKLLETDKKIVELMERYQNIDMEDTSTWSNQAVFFTRQLWNMLVLARVITIGAYNRNESRGAHYKPEFPDRNDEEWLKQRLLNLEDLKKHQNFHMKKWILVTLNLVNVITLRNLKEVNNYGRHSNS